MPRFFLSLRDGGKLLKDDEGPEEFADVEDARRAAIESARELLSQAALTGKAASLDLHIDVKDDTGNTLFTVSAGHSTDTDSQG